MQIINYDPGIFGFVKAHKHSSGSSLVMTTWEEDDVDWIGIYWVKRLHHQAKPISGNFFPLRNPRSIMAAERTYEVYASLGPPADAVADVQKQRVYDWEDDNIFPGHDNPMTWRGCERFLDYVWKKVGHRGNLIIKQSPLYTTAICIPGIIYLPANDNSYWSRPMILHELTHELKPTAQHGPDFVTTYIKMCCRFLGHNELFLKASAHRYGVVLKA